MAEDNKYPPDADQSIFGLEKHHSIPEKFGLTLGFLILGPLLGLVYVMALANPEWSDTWRWILERFVTVLAAFYFSSLVFIWWRPDWLRRHYASVEKKLVRGIAIFFVSIFLYGLVGAIWEISRQLIPWIK